LLGERTFVMGILNLTPDSFAGGITDVAAAVDAALQIEADGADLLDVGGESTRPGAEPVDAAVELARIAPVMARLSGRLRIPISVDTYKSAVAREALAAGASIVNDISGGRLDPALAGVAAAAGAPLVLMHSRGTPNTMNSLAAYDDVVRELVAELEVSIDAACRAGMPRAQIVVDPGIGFAKRAEHSYGVLARLPEVAAGLDRPLLAGVSRKSFLRATLGDAPAAARDWGTAAAVTAAVLGGAHIVRVHSVAAMVQAARVADGIRMERNRAKG
jgi:dihydropteroate synthase